MRTTEGPRRARRPARRGVRAAARASLVAQELEGSPFARLLTSRDRGPSPRRQEGGTRVTIELRRRLRGIRRLRRFPVPSRRASASSTRRSRVWSGSWLTGAGGDGARRTPSSCPRTRLPSCRDDRGGGRTARARRRSALERRPATAGGPRRARARAHRRGRRRRARARRPRGPRATRPPGAAIPTSSGCAPARFETAPDAIVWPGWRRAGGRAAVDLRAGARGGGCRSAGGTSVVGGVEALRGDCEAVVALDLGRSTGSAPSTSGRSPRPSGRAARPGRRRAARRARLHPRPLPAELGSTSSWAGRS